MSNTSYPRRRVRSFVRRDGRMTDAQKNALATVWPRIGLHVQDGPIHLERIFAQEASCILEIGFGSGHSLLEMAKAQPGHHFIGIETHLPGIGTLLLNIYNKQLHNIRIYYADAVDVLTQCIPDDSLDGIQIFFPDPWPKRKHHKRRLIQTPFVQLLLCKLKLHGCLHLATDWQHYAEQMMTVLSSLPQLENQAGIRQYAMRSIHRPVVTKFEKRGTESGRAVWELQFIKCSI